jgi:hypothetical protein
MVILPITFTTPKALQWTCIWGFMNQSVGSHMIGVSACIEDKAVEFWHYKEVYSEL